MKFPGRVGVRVGVLSISLIAFVLLNVWLALFAKHLDPVKNGTPEEFWDAMYQLNLSDNQYGLDVYPPQGDRCIYYIQGLHGQFLHEVSRNEVRQLLPVVRELAPRRMKERLSEEEEALLESESSIDQLVWARIHAQEADRRKHAPDLAGFGYQSVTGFFLRWERVERYWVNILFEGLYLNSLLFVGLLPFMGECRHWIRGLATGLVFPLLFLPYYLGYCPLAFTSAGGSGALYPLIMQGFAGFPISWNPLDIWLFESLPKPLEWIAQFPGGMMSISGAGSPSPTVTVVMGALVGAMVYGASRFVGRLKTRNDVAPEMVP